MVGKFALASAIVTPVIIFSQMNLRHSLVTDIKQDYHFLDCLYSRLIFTLIALVVILLIAWISQDSTEMLVITAIMGLAKGIESISDIFHARFQQAERMDFIAVSLILKGCINIIFFAALAWVFRDLFWPMLSMAVIWGIILCAYDIPKYKKISKPSESYSWKKGVFARLFRTTLPLSLNSLFGSLSSNVPRYLLEFFGSKESIGMFTIATAPLNFITLLQTSLMQTVLHRLAVYYQKNDHENFEKLSHKTLLILLSISGGFTLLFVFAGRQIIELLFSSEYVSVAPVLVIMSISTIFTALAIYFVFPILVGRRFKEFATASLTLLCSQFVISLYLIKHYGVIGAGIAELAKTILSIFINYFYARRALARNK